MFNLAVYRETKRDEDRGMWMRYARSCLRIALAKSVANIIIERADENTAHKLRRHGNGAPRFVNDRRLPPGQQRRHSALYESAHNGPNWWNAVPEISQNNNGEQQPNQVSAAAVAAAQVAAGVQAPAVAGGPLNYGQLVELTNLLEQAQQAGQPRGAEGAQYLRARMDPTTRDQFDARADAAKTRLLVLHAKHVDHDRGLQQWMEMVDVPADRRIARVRNSNIHGVQAGLYGPNVAGVVVNHHDDDDDDDDAVQVSQVAV